jgi:hypothetical protein
MTGQWPRDDYEDTPSAPLSAAVQSRIRYMNIQYAKGRQRDYSEARA